MGVRQNFLLFNLKFKRYETIEFTMPEITISYKDNVKASERIKILSSETSYSYLKPFYVECMEHHEEKLCNVP